jgi:hypothetical protein
MDKDSPLIHIEQRRENSSIICHKVDDKVSITLEVNGNCGTMLLGQVALKHLIAGLSKGIDNG